MGVANANAAGLTPEELQRLDAWLREFELRWGEEALARSARELPPAGSFRQAALVAMVRIDLRRQWQQGRKKFLEDYLREYPEVGTPETVSLDLIQAEMQARGQAADPGAGADLMRRFPRQAEQLRRGLEQMLHKAEPAALPAADARATDPNSCALGTLKPSGSLIDGTLTPAAGVKGRGFPYTGERYQLLKELGRGAMGTVYLAHDAQLQRDVAMKVPHFQMGADTELRERFYREARAAAVLRHPNICPVYDVGESDGIPYLTMAYIEGQPLGEVLRANRPMPQRRAVDIVSKLARALEEAHRKGVVHRDLKPGNIMVDRHGEPIVMDFGLARRLDRDIRLTNPGDVLGTPAYMSPEQVENDRDAVGPASDQYSLGVILYELLTGKVPYEGATGYVLAQILTEAPRPPSSLRPDLDLALEKICLRAMARKPADRYPSMAEFAEALAGCLQISSKPSPDIISPASGTRNDFHDDTVKVDPNHEGVSCRRTRRRFLTVLVAATAVLLLGALASLIWLLQREPRAIAIAIHSTPPGALVFLDGKPLDPLGDGKYAVAPGKHELRLELAGYHPLLEEIVVAAADAGKPFRYTLRKIVPVVSQPVEVPVLLRSEPTGAEVWLSGKLLSQRTNLKLLLLPGKYEARLVLAGYEPRTVAFEVPADSKGLTFDYSLKPLMRDVVLSITPPDARVEIAGKLQTPSKDGVVRLALGKHRMDLARAGYKPRTEYVEVLAGEGPQRFEYELAPLRAVKYALLVGVHQPAGGLADFLHAEPDVVALGRLLVAGGYERDNVVVLTQTLGERNPTLWPSAATVRDGLRALLKRCTPADSVLVALVGRAVQLPGAEGCYFCPADTDVKDRKTLLALSEVSVELRQCKAKSRLLVLDCWRHGDGTTPRPKAVVPDADFPVLLACAWEEWSYEHPEQRHGAFMAAVLRELLEPGDGTLAGLADAVRQRVAAQVKREYSTTQTPELLGGVTGAARPALHLDGAPAAFGRGIASLEKASVLKDGPEKSAAYKDAVAALTEAVKRNEKFVEAYTRRAEAYYSLEKFAEAVEDCRAALRLDGDDATAHSHLGEALTQLKNFTEALASHEKAIRLEPGYAPAYNERGQTYFQARNVEDNYRHAIKDFSEAIRLKARFKWALFNRGYAHYRLGLQHKQSGDGLKAKDAFDSAIMDESSAIKLDAAFREAYVVRAMAYAAAGNAEAAAADRKRAHELGKNQSP